MPVGRCFSGIAGHWTIQDNTAEDELSIAAPSNTPVPFALAVIACILGAAALCAYADSGKGEMIPWLAITTYTTAASWIDLRLHIIPNRLHLVFLFLLMPILLARIVCGGEMHSLVLLRCAVGGLGWFSILLFLAWLTRGSIGAGDVKMFGLTGAYLGFYNTFSVFFYAMVICAVTGIVLIIRKEATKKSTLPFGPFAALGCLFVLSAKVLIQ